MGREALDSAYFAFRRSFDPRLGGFGAAPKFPRPSIHNFLVRYAVIDKNEQMFANPDRTELRSTNLVWPPLLRKLDRLDPSYRN